MLALRWRPAGQFAVGALPAVPAPPRARVRAPAAARRGVRNGHSIAGSSHADSRSRQPGDQAGSRSRPQAALSELTVLGESIGPVPQVLLRDGLGSLTATSGALAGLPNDHGRYRLMEEIARGGMGAIIKGRDVDLGRDLAVKVILDEHRDHPEMVCRFIEEAQIGGQLEHPGIVPVHEIGRFADGRLYIAMKLVQGRTLAEFLKQRPNPEDDRPRLLSVFEQVCQTMAYAHVRGVVHRDLKPSNVMMGHFGEVQVMDWGLAKVLGADQAASEARDQGYRRAQSSCVPSAPRRTRMNRVPTRCWEPRPTWRQNRREGRSTRLTNGPTSSRQRDPLRDPDRCAALHRTHECRTSGQGRSCRPGRCSGTVRRLRRRRRPHLARARLSGGGSQDRPRDAGMVLARVADYLVGVEARLRAAGLAQAKAEARAAEERKRRLLTMALAASVLAIALLAGGAWSWTTGERAARGS